ncbi:hypothetical protein HSX10_16235 [Winogradskyella undariae]|uniref:hypothetical protein n=1 Tax=Winogradskyella undariae TaxID=1285465 RepID=UPI00156B9B42|nr:hypothetical protein [Winogradskyella undariae]NRR93126.1 hypothetical protein [Winogradskyella undariae]
MKNPKNLFVLLLSTILFFSCTPESLLDEEPVATEDIYATGDNSSGEIDNDRDN